MVIIARFFSMLLLMSTLFLQGCTSTDQAALSQNLSKAIHMKYVHIANVRMFQSGSVQFVGVENGSFWAVFEICSLDIQGGALSGFNYSADSFYIDAGSTQYGSETPGNIHASSVVMSSQSSQVKNAARNAFSLSPQTQYFPKQFYPNLNYRIAIYVKEHPVGYGGDSLTLKYDGQPQVAAIVQDVSSGNPVYRSFYHPSVSPQIVGACP